MNSNENVSDFLKSNFTERGLCLSPLHSTKFPREDCCALYVFGI